MAGTPEFMTRLDRQEADARMLAEAEPTRGASHTAALLTALATAGDWHQLREQAARHAESSDPNVAIQARRMLALGLAQSSEAPDRGAAVDLYRSLAAEGLGEAVDLANLATLLSDGGLVDEAKAVVLEGIARFGASASLGFHEIGLRIVEKTGDRDFREQLKAAIAARARRD
jgi:hypothetical protein